MSRLNDKQHAISAILILLLFLSPLILIPVELWSKWQEYDEHIERTMQSLERYQGMVESKAKISAEIAKFKRQLEGRYFFSASRAAALVAGDMQKKINRLADDNNAMVASTRVLAIKSDEQWLRHGISVNMRGSIQSARAILHELANSRPYMEIDKLKIRGTAVRHRRGKKVTQAKREVTLTFELYAWQLK